MRFSRDSKHSKHEILEFKFDSLFIDPTAVRLALRRTSSKCDLDKLKSRTDFKFRVLDIHTTVVARKILNPL